MKFRENSEAKGAEMQLAPMIDVVFLLLVFFIVSWNFAKFEAEVNVSVPETEETDSPQQAQGEIVIGVTEDGTVRVNNQLMGQDELYFRLERIATLFPKQPVILRAEERTDYVHVMNVLDTCQKAGIWNVAFAADEAPPAR